MTQFLVKVGDCRDVLRRLPAGCVDLIVTSPPYADARIDTYGGIHPDECVEWFLPRSGEFRRVLTPSGTFILNIKEKVVDGERHRYVINLIGALCDQGWLWTEEFVWHKKNSVPGKWPNRFRDAWERLLQFNKQRDFAMYQDAVMIPAADSTQYRKRFPLATEGSRRVSATGSGVRIELANWYARDTAYPTNVLHLSTESGNKGHSAAFPQPLPEYFIKLFTKQGGIVLDPFVGSGTSGAAARMLDRRFIGIDLLEQNVAQATRRIAACAAQDEMADSSCPAVS